MQCSHLCLLLEHKQNFTSYPCKHSITLDICLILLNGYLVLYDGTIISSKAFVDGYLGSVLLMVVNTLVHRCIFVSISVGHIPRSRTAE